MLVAGVGNIFLGDDGFGPEVIRHVPAHDGVRLVDYGIRGLHLAYDLLDPWDALVLVDAIPSRGEPGAVHVIEVDHEAPQGDPGVDAHGMDPGTVFASLRALGGTPPYTVVVGCEARDVAEGIGLSGPVAGAVDRAAAAVSALAARLLAREG